MNTAANQVAPAARPASNVPKLSEEMLELRPELEKVLPAHITPDKFMRVVNTAISQNPDLYRADRRSLFTACVKCATDGLLPDGREAALVIYNTKQKWKDEKGITREDWIQKVQYMPMVYGVLKKVRNSGELQSISSNVVLEQDEFRYWIDDVGEHITHEPNLQAADRGKIIAVYAIAKTKDGGVYTEVMTRQQIDQVRAVSKSKDKGPWVEWYDEMARKSVIRRLSKRLPMSTDLERVIQRDDEMYDLRQRGTATAQSGVDAAKQLLGITAPAATLGHDDGSDEANFNYDEESGEVIENEPSQGQQSGGTQSQKAHQQVYTEESAIAKIRECTTKAQAEGVIASIVADYKAAGKPVPVAVDGTYNDRIAAIDQASKKK